ncbi:MAG TPA: NAD(P)H-hydrate dehydratase [Gemmatimonadaceae bacterium]|nr:NAD(P)H-hydrate dehydratase [Gemmatimonadaceae bacterium]
MRRLRPSNVTRGLLKEWPLPDLESHDDKDDRGAILIVGGSASLAGAVVLAGTAALRAGAGKLQIATSRSVAPLVAIAVPESKSVGLRETRDGTIASSAASTIRSLTKDIDALVVGPGMEDSSDTRNFVTKIVREIRDVAVVLDAGAISSLGSRRGLLRNLDGNAVITPHAGEMATLMKKSKDEITGNAIDWAMRSASELNAVVVLKGADTVIADPSGEVFRYRGGSVGLATSGSGDTLAGILGGLLARGASPVQASVWAVFIHGEAGRALDKRVGRVGFLAREIVDEVPGILETL